MESGSAAGFSSHGSKVPADHLVGKAARAVEVESNECGLVRVDTLEDELVQQVVVARGQVEGLHGLAVKHHLQRSAHIGAR